MNKHTLLIVSLYTLTINSNKSVRCYESICSERDIDRLTLHNDSAFVVLPSN